jgi:hypothetical protein
MCAPEQLEHKQILLLSGVERIQAQVGHRQRHCRGHSGTGQARHGGGMKGCQGGCRAATLQVHHAFVIPHKAQAHPPDMRPAEAAWTASPAAPTAGSTAPRSAR